MISPSHMHRNHPPRRSTAESGVFLAITAVITVALIAAIAYLGIRAPISKIASAELRLELEDICRNITETTYLNGEADNYFRTRIGEMSIRFADVSFARIILPSMRLGISPDPTAYCQQPGGGINPIECVTCGAVPCEIIRDPCDPSIMPLSPGGIPAGGCGGDSPALLYFWNDTGDASFISPQHAVGNTVFCEASATLDTGFLGSLINQNSETNISARVVYWRRPRTLNLDTWDTTKAPGVFSDTDKRPPPLLSIIVAPYGQVRHSLDARFDPFQAETSDGARWLSGDNWGHSTHFTAAYPMAEPVLYNSLDLGPEFNAPDEVRLRPLPSLTGNDRLEHLDSCLSLPVLARNAFLYEFLAYAARNGFYRNNIQLLVAEPQHRVAYGDEEPEASEHPVWLNPPVLVSSPGQDILDDLYQLPFVSYFGGVRGDPGAPYFIPAAYYSSASGLPGAYDPDPNISEHRRQGWLQPFAQSDGGGWEPVDKTDKLTDSQRNGFVSGQLRNCFRLFDGANQRQAYLNYEMFPYNFASQDFEFEPAGLYDLEDESTDGTPQYWPQHCPNISPWDYSEEGVPDCSITPESINLVEFVASLGMAQQCPLQNSISCQKPADPKNDLRGDLLASFYALSAQQNVPSPNRNGTNPSPPIPPVAIRSPGIGRLRSDFTLSSEEHRLRPFSFGNSVSGGGGGEVDGYGAYVSAARPAAGDDIDHTILVITHQPLHSTEMTYLRMLIGNAGSGFRNTQIVVVYMPLYQYDPGSSDEELKQLTAAQRGQFATAILGGDADGNLPPGFDPSLRSVVVLSPYSVLSDPSDPESALFYHGNNPSADFGSYWVDLLKDDSPAPGGNIHAKVKAVWDTITQSQRKL